MSKGKDEAFEKAYASVVESGWTSVKHMARQVWDMASATPPAAQVQGELPDRYQSPAYCQGLEQERDYLRTQLQVARKGFPGMVELAGEIAQLRAALSAPPAADMTDAYVGAREDVAIWKRRALEAEQKVRVLDQRIDQLVLDAQGETRMGEPHIAPPAAGVPDALDKARRHLSDAIEDVEDGKASAALPALREAAHYLT
jgi:hypothetical protein